MKQELKFRLQLNCIEIEKTIFHGCKLDFKIGYSSLFLFLLSHSLFLNTHTHKHSITLTNKLIAHTQFVLKNETEVHISLN